MRRTARKAFLFISFVMNVFREINADYAEKPFPTLKNFLTTETKTLVVKGRVDTVAVDGMKRRFNLMRRPREVRKYYPTSEVAPEISL